MTIQMKATEQYFPVVLFIMLHKVVLALHSKETTVTKQYFSEFIMLRNIQWRVIIVGVENRRA